MVVSKICYHSTFFELISIAMRTRIKICGITRPEDGHEAVRLGVDAIGLVFHPPSPRAISIEQAQRIVAALPPFATIVALFVDPKAEAVHTILEAVPVDLIQFHGSEKAPFCAQFERPYIKAIRMKKGINLEQEITHYPSASGLLLDSYESGIPGGTGKTFDWDAVGKQMQKPIILAGGLTPGNVDEAIVRTLPYAVDVSSGVEAEKGIKDATKMAAFINEVKRVDAS